MSAKRFSEKNCVGRKQLWLDAQLRLVRELDDACIELKREAVGMAKAVYGELYDLMRSVPGVGDVLAALILAEVGDIRRFPSARHFKSYCGLAPRVRESGGKARLGRCRRSNPYLRWAFYQAAVVAIRYDSELKAFYERLVKRGKHPRGCSYCCCWLGLLCVLGVCF